MSTPDFDPAKKAGPEKTSGLQTLFRWILGAFLVFAGTSHLTFARKEFQAQVPDFVPLSPDLVVILSGLVEITLGASLLFLARFRKSVGLVVAAFFVAIFPGNIAQYVNHRDAFGLSSDQARFVRLLGQPVLVAWALWATGAWKALRSGKK